MRIGALAACLVGACSVVGACSQPTGAMFELESKTSFDGLEVFFGTNAGERIPLTPGRPAAIDVEAQRLIKRMLAEDDVGPARKQPGTSWRYFVPSYEENRGLGDYMLAIAYLDGVPVAIGEVFDFEVATDAVNIYPVPMLAYGNQEIERWGRPDSDCIRWTRDRGANQPRSIAVVRGNDSDCDSFDDQNPTNADCAPLSYCNLVDGKCEGLGTCFDEANGTCASGLCTNVVGTARACMPVVCLDPTLCTQCAGHFTADSVGLLDCALDGAAGGPTHADYTIPITQTDTLCTEPYSVDLNFTFPCLAPEVVDSRNSKTSGSFVYDIKTIDANVCRLTITPVIPGAPFTGVPHLVISVQNPQGAQFERSRFVVALKGEFNPTSPACSSLAPLTITTDLQSCGPP